MSVIHGMTVWTS